MAACTRQDGPQRQSHQCFRPGGFACSQASPRPTRSCKSLVAGRSRGSLSSRSVSGRSRSDFRSGRSNRSGRSGLGGGRGRGLFLLRAGGQGSGGQHGSQQNRLVHWCPQRRVKRITGNGAEPGEPESKPREASLAGYGASNLERHWRQAANSRGLPVLRIKAPRWSAAKRGWIVAQLHRKALERPVDPVHGATSVRAHAPVR